MNRAARPDSVGAGSAAGFPARALLGMEGKAGEARQGWPGRGRAGLGMGKAGVAWRSMAGPGQAWQGEARQGAAADSRRRALPEVQAWAFRSCGTAPASSVLLAGELDDGRRLGVRFRDEAGASSTEPSALGDAERRADLADLV